MKILVDHTQTAGIPLLAFYQLETAARLPLVLIMHGYTGAKEDLFQIGYTLAQQGYYAVSLDLHLHGELGETPFNPAKVSPRFIEVIEKSVANLRTLVSAYQQAPRVDPDRIGLMGFSLGGAVIYAYLPHRQPGVQAAVCMIAGPAPVAEHTFRCVQQIYPHFGVTDALVAELGELGRQQPFLEGVRDFPLLMQYGQTDPIIPITEVRRLYGQVKLGYTQPEKIVLAEYANTGHETPPAMLERAAAWFKEHLLDERKSQ